MKKEYIKPEILVEEFISDIYMQSASSSTDIEGGKPGESGDPDANGHRGTWGDLWD